jgi:hypothetical protein
MLWRQLRIIVGTEGGCGDGEELKALRGRGTNFVLIAGRQIDHGIRAHGQCAAIQLDLTFAAGDQHHFLRAPVEGLTVHSLQKVSF